jgi:hypothetical protein
MYWSVQQADTDTDIYWSVQQADTDTEIYWSVQQADTDTDIYWQHALRFFSSGVHVPFYLHFWGYIQIFGSAISNSSFGGTEKINCIFSMQGRAPCCFL